ncbi:S8 family serine peptidase [Tunicatimonas pelagia]|uniref:S8 family serine peptidase n=1 Tax=Tunicatimonas pelagia TaxID=931531 RepID=UPI002666F595|nr:S8 family serine peptidase [Tunicatimonas pelagia]WKN41665.1 S8 family serine peptidase [Tunicatimonas pelagia]
MHLSVRFYLNQAYCVVLLTIFMVWAAPVVLAQTNEVAKHKIWVKLKEAVPEHCGAPETITTGKPSLDKLSKNCSVTGIRRVFPRTHKFEKAHQKYGLHQWYEVEFADTLSTPENELAALFCKNTWVSTAEAIPVQTLFTTDDSDTLVLTNDPRYEDQWHFNNTGQSGGSAGSDIRLAAGRFFNSGDSRVIVAVIDGGIDTDHEDLQPALWVNPLEKTGEFGVDDDGNGYVDDVYGYDFSASRGRVYSDKHGTHVAGTVGAVTNNGIGVAGVAGGDGENAGVQLMSCVVFGRSKQGGFPAAFVYAADNGAVIAQNSWGGGGKSEVLESAIRYFNERAGYDNTDEKFDQNIQVGPMAGGLVVFAAGNNKTNKAESAYPASLATVMAVASLDHNDKKSDFSNYGDWVDIAAPGSEVLSTFPGNSYGYLSGTSMAAPHVTGVAALAISRFQRQGFTRKHLSQILLVSADNVDSINPSYQAKLGVGRINAYRALSVDTEQPPATITNLSAGAITFNSVKLNFTAPGTDGQQGTAAYYEVYLSKKPIKPNEIGSAYRQLTELPRVAGTADTVTIAKLQHTTPYYFSLRAVDLLGNASLWSKAIRATTDEPPRIKVQPEALTATVEAGQLRVDTLVIDNTLGKSPLTFQLSLDSAAVLGKWLQLTTDSGTVAAGSVQEIRISWNARSLYASNLKAELRIDSNDPDNPTVNIPVQLTVTGTPELHLSSSRLLFGEVYRTFSRDRKLIARNTGTDTLIVDNIISDNDLFAVEKEKVVIPPRGRYTIQVTFSPENLDQQEGKLTVSSNDPQQPSTIVLLEGVGVEPPPLLLTPAEIVTEIVQGDSLTQTIRLQNTSFTDTLRWSVNEVLPDWLVLSAPVGTLPPREAGSINIKLQTAGQELGQYRTDIRLLYGADESEVLPVTMTVIEPNQPPVWSDSIINLSVVINRAESRFNLANFVTDPEGDSLRFNFQWEGSARASASVTDSILLIKSQQEGISKGIINVTDEADNKAQATLVLTILPENRSPQPIQDTLLVAIRLEGESARLQLDSLFFDPDQDSMTYSFTRPSFSADDLNILKSTVVDLRIEDKLLIGQANALGEQKVVLYAYDPVGEYSSVTLIISVLPPNQPPLVTQEIDNQHLVEFQQWAVSLSTIFSDPDGDTLTFQAMTDDPNVAQVELSADSLRITAQSLGETAIQIQAQDQAGDSVTLTFNLKVDQVTSTLSLPVDEGFRIYPNPAVNWVTVDYAEVRAIKIYNSQGQELYTRTVLPTSSLRLSVASLPSGMYSVVIFTQRGETYQTSLIKQ